MDHHAISDIDTKVGYGVGGGIGSSEEDNIPGANITHRDGRALVEDSLGGGSSKRINARMSEYPSHKGATIKSIWSICSIYIRFT